MLTVDYTRKAGEMTFQQTFKGVTERFTYDLYKGNAYLIAINNRDGEKELVLFFLDNWHMKNMLGLNKKGGENHLDTSYETVTDISLNKREFGAKETVEIATAFAKAFDNININIYTA